jgi:hypothetical protein
MYFISLWTGVANVQQLILSVDKKGELKTIIKPAKNQCAFYITTNQKLQRMAAKTPLYEGRGAQNHPR